MPELLLHLNASVKNLKTALLENKASHEGSGKVLDKRHMLFEFLLEMFRQKNRILTKITSAFLMHRVCAVTTTLISHTFFSVWQQCRLYVRIHFDDVEI